MCMCNFFTWQISTFLWFFRKTYFIFIFYFLFFSHAPHIAPTFILSLYLMIFLILYERVSIRFRLYLSLSVSSYSSRKWWWHMVRSFFLHKGKKIPHFSLSLPSSRHLCAVLLEKPLIMAMSWKFWSRLIFAISSSLPLFLIFLVTLLYCTVMCTVLMI